MPSKSESQAWLMKKACHDAEFAKKHGIDQEVACEFYRKDQELKKAGKSPAVKWGDKPKKDKGKK